MDNKEIKIFSAFHKAYEYPQNSFIHPIQVGDGPDLGLTRDNTGENISSKNKTYSELTALYWIWKHLDKIDSTYIGLSHYRRNFTLPKLIEKKKLFGTKIKIDQSSGYTTPLSKQALAEIAASDLRTALMDALNAGKVVVPRHLDLSINEEYPCSIKTHYIYSHIREDWELMESAIAKLYPEYVADAKAIFETKKMFCYNMFIGDKQFINDYCSWMFPILSELEQTVKLCPYPYQHRIFGFFSERLINLYLLRNNIPTAEFPVLFFD